MRRLLREHWPLLLVGAAMVIGLVARMQTIRDVFDLPWPHAFSEDDHYHLRRVLWGLRNAGMLEHDPFMSFPQGAYSWWPDGFDQLLIALCRLTVGRDATMPEVVAVCSLTVPLLSIAVLPLVYLLGRRLHGRGVGALAALIVALLPAHAYPGLAGVVDHHCTETLLSLAPILALGTALSTENARAAAAWGALAGALVGSTLHVWSGAPLISVVIVGAAGLATLGLERARWRAVGSALAAFALASLLLTVEAVLQAPLGKQGAYVSFIVSRFHILFAAALSALLFLWIAAGVRTSRTAPRPLAHLLVFAGVLVVLVPLVGLPLGLRPHHAVEASAFIRSEGIVAWIEETMPLWSSFGNAFAHFSYALAILPLAAVFSTVRALRRRDQDRFSALAETAGLAFLVLTCLQFRHKVHWVPMAAVGIAWSFLRLHKTIVGRAPNQSRAAALGLVLVGLALFYKPLVYLRDVTLRPQGTDLLRACDFIRAHSPDEGAYAAEPKPTFSVLGSWDVGKTIAGVCERPSIGSADAYGEQLAAVLDLMRFFTTSDPDEGARIVDRYRARYLLLPEQYLKHWEAAIAMVGLPRARFLDANDSLGEGAITSLYWRLYHYDGVAIGQADRRLPALRDYRLRYESEPPDAPPDAAAAKVFERVEGAYLTASLPPGAPALIESLERTNTGRRFAYRDFATADASGRLRVRFPYLGHVSVKTPLGPLSADVRAADQGREVRLR